MFSRWFFATALAWTTLAQAELAWEKPVQEFRRTPEDLELLATYTYRNTGSQPVEIIRVATSCGCCTTAPLDHKKIAPGEAGSIGIKFTFEGRRGDQQKTIAVSTSDGRQVSLELRCLIEEMLTISPALVFWRIGESPEPKTIELVAVKGHPVKVTEIKSSSPNISATLKTLEEGQLYSITVRPVATAQREICQIAVQTDSPADAPRGYVIHARIK